MDRVSLLVLTNGQGRLPLDDLGGQAIITIGDTADASQPAASSAQVILNWRSDRTLLEQVWPMAKQLEWVHTRSAGVDGLLFPELVESPVTLTNARGVFSDILAEFAIGAVLFFAKSFRRLITNQMAGKWEPFETIEISRQTLGLIGFGDIGRAVSSRARALGMRVIALRRRPALTPDDSQLAEVFPPERTREMLSQSDYVVVTAPLTPDSRGLIAAPEFAVMKHSAVLINIGRGPVIDEPALIEALRQRRIRGAALDVFHTEPLPAGHPFYTLDNVLLSPHSADQTSDWQERSMRVFVDNFRRFRNGEPLLNVVNKKLGY